MVWTQFPLHPDTPPEGLPLEALHPERTPEQRAAGQARMKGLMEAEGLPYGDRSHTYNSRLAQELSKWADAQPGGAALHDALFRAYFAELRNIAQPDVLVDVAASVGLSGEEARTVLEARTFADAVDQDWLRSRSIGVTGVPTFVIDMHGVVGAQPYEVLEQFVQEYGRKERPEED